MNYPIIDLHCDLLSYLAKAPNASIHNTEDIGVALPHLKAGNVKHQVLAIFAPTKLDSTILGQKQVVAYQNLIKEDDFYPIIDKKTAQNIAQSQHIGVTVSIESGSAFAEEEEELDQSLERLDKMIKACGHLFYISFTHHTENRFGGGNYSDNIGLKRDGELLLEYMSGKKIAVDLSHASDNLAYDIINYIDKKGLDIPVIASHSNFRPLCGHVRNLPNDLTAEIVNRKGLIGMNFLRAYIHPTEPQHLIQHILHGLKPDVALDQLAFGADFFYLKALNDPARLPLFFPEHQDASKYPTVLEDLKKEGVTADILEKLAYKNALNFIHHNW